MAILDILFLYPDYTTQCSQLFLFKVHTQFPYIHLQDGRISYEEFATMMKAGTDWRKASRQYSRERFNSLSLRLMKEGSLQLDNESR